MPYADRWSTHPIRLPPDAAIRDPASAVIFPLRKPAPSPCRARRMRRAAPAGEAPAAAVRRPNSMASANVGNIGSGGEAPGVSM